MWNLIQSKLGVTADGVPGPKTWTALLTKTLGRAPLPGVAEGFSHLSFPTPQRLADFIAQTAHESMNHTKFEENLSYSAERLHVVWPSRFPTIASAQPFARNPQALANKVYGGRMGNTDPNDGYKYRGRGVLQLTGKSNYALYGYVSNPDALTDPPTSLAVAYAFYTKNGIWALIDSNHLTDARKRVNGGTLGIAEVNAIRQKVLNLAQ